MEVLSFMDFAVVDSLFRDEWLRIRSTGLGGSDAGSFSKIESADRYAVAKIRRGFGGNSYTDFGNRWEEAALAAVGIPRNTWMFRHPQQPRFFSTPDGVMERPGGLMIAEAKCRSDAVSGEFRITPTHMRQMQWNMGVLGAQLCEYVVLPYDKHTMTPVTMVPYVVRIPFEPDEFERLAIIATAVLARMRAAADFERVALGTREETR
jgi:hypothetical protein